MVFVDLVRNVEDSPKPSLGYSSTSQKTVFGQEFLGLIVDEAHKARKFNKYHQAIHALRKKSNSMVAMTATPVMTQLQVNFLLYPIPVYSLNIVLGSLDSG